MTFLGALNDESSHSTAAALIGVTVTVAIMCLVYVYRAQRAPEVWPNVLRENFDAESIHEVDGVQFVVMPATVVVPSGGFFEVAVFAQNCWDAELVFTVFLIPATRLSFNRKKVLTPQNAEINLEGGEVVRVVIRCVVEPGAVGSHPIQVHVRSSGRGGRRIRKWRADEVSSQIPAWVNGIGAFAGFLSFGGGMQIKAIVEKTGPIAVTTSVVSQPSHQTEIVWTPDGAP